jgi:uncharacterized protein (TIGR02271 family)
MTSDNGKRQRDEHVVPVMEEELRVDKRDVVTGKIQVRTIVESFDKIARATLEGEQIEVTRVPIGKELQMVPEQRTEGDVLIIPVVEEMLVVEKRLVLKEELHIRRRRTREDVEVPVTLRKQRAVVEHTRGETHPNEEAEK